jgi:hypothetical protein
MLLHDCPNWRVKHVLGMDYNQFIFRDHLKWFVNCALSSVTLSLRSHSIHTLGSACKSLISRPDSYLTVVPRIRFAIPELAVDVAPWVNWSRYAIFVTRKLLSDLNRKNHPLNKAFGNARDQYRHRNTFPDPIFWLWIPDSRVSPTAPTIPPGFTRNSIDDDLRFTGLTLPDCRLRSS